MILKPLREYWRCIGQNMGCLHDNIPMPVLLKGFSMFVPCEIAIYRFNVDYGHWEAILTTKPAVYDNDDCRESPGILPSELKSRWGKDLYLTLPKTAAPWKMIAVDFQSPKVQFYEALDKK